MRVSLFLFGLCIGIFILIFFLKKKGVEFNYLPHDRILSDIRQKRIVYGGNITSKDTAMCREIATDGYIKLPPVKRGICNDYLIYDSKTNQISILVANCDSIVLIKELNP